MWVHVICCSEGTMSQWRWSLLSGIFVSRECICFPTYCFPWIFTLISHGGWVGGASMVSWKGHIAWLPRSSNETMLSPFTTILLRLLLVKLLLERLKSETVVWCLIRSLSLLLLNQGFNPNNMRYHYMLCLLRFLSCSSHLHCETYYRIWSIQL